MPNLSSVRASLFFLFSLMVSASAVARPAIVVIDPGHGGDTRGGMPGQRLAQKGFTLDTAKKVAQGLRKRIRIKVTINRDNDTFGSFTKRKKTPKQDAGRVTVIVSWPFQL